MNPATAIHPKSASQAFGARVQRIRAAVRGADRRLVAAAFAVAALLLGAAPSGAWGIGSLVPQPGAAGCISTSGSKGACRDGRKVGGSRTAISPDGRNLYVANYVDSTVAVFGRDPRTGALRQEPGGAGCVSAKAGSGCSQARSFDGADAIAISPDGKNAYVASEDSNSVTIFNRDPSSGVLRQKSGAAGCVSEAGSACQKATSIQSPADLAVSPDGKNLYVVSDDSDSVAVFDRDPASGALTQKPGQAGCFSGAAAETGCQQAHSFTEPVRLVVTPDGKSVYVTSYEQPPKGSSRTGPSAVTIFDRDPATGTLTQKPGAAGCLASGTAGPCRRDRRLEYPADAAVSPDGRSVYVVSPFPGTLFDLDRDPATGALSQKPGAGGCVSQDGSNGACRKSEVLAGANGVAVSPDGKNVYVADSFSKSISIFERNRATGALRRARGAASCVSRAPRDWGCLADDALSQPASLLVSPDGTNVYSVGLYPGTVSIFDRAVR